VSSIIGSTTRPTHSGLSFTNLGWISVLTEIWRSLSLFVKQLRHSRTKVFLMFNTVIILTGA